MTTSPHDLQGGAAPGRRGSRTRRVAVWLLVGVVAVLVLDGLAVFLYPWLVHYGLIG